MDFKSLNIIEPILGVLEKEGYIVPTPIQAKTIPLLLEGQDVVGIAQTGTGKTAAFAIPILQKLSQNSKNTQTKKPKALVLAPTRELAAQISDSFRTYGRSLRLKHTSVYGGVSIVPQIRTIQRGVDILIATPGRLLDLMNQHKVSLDKIEYLVLDEADRMLDMGFLKDVTKIISALPKNRHSLFFSATMSKEVSELARRFLKNPQRVEISSKSLTVEKIKHSVFFINSENKNELLLDLIKQEKMNRVLIFVNAKHKANKISDLLNTNGIMSNAIHGNKSQSQRTLALNDFKKGKIQVLVATDIAARGIDVDNISHVINYDIPNEPENYIHRIGRTARAGTDGIAYSFCVAEDRNFLNEIERLTKIKTPEADHKYHSNIAKNARGAQAKPRPRTQGRGARRGNSRRWNDGGRDRKKFSGRDRKSSGGRDRKSFSSRGSGKENLRGRPGGSRSGWGDGRKKFGRNRPGENRSGGISRFRKNGVRFHSKHSR